MASTAAELGKKFRDTATTVQRSQKAVITVCADVAKHSLLSVPGAPRLMRNVGRGARLNVRYDVRGFNNPTALVRWVGPAHLANNPTKPHTILPRGRTRRRGNAKALALPAGPRASAQHPGTHGKRFYQAGREIAEKTVPETYRRQMRLMIARHFTGG